jgi:hypothetical protein
MKTLRSVLGVVLGLLVGIAAGVGVSVWLFGGESDGGSGPWLAAVLVFALAQILAGFLTATIAGRRRLVHAGIVAGLFALSTVAAIIRRFEIEPGWYWATVVCVGAVAILLGGYLATMIRLRK